MCNSVGQNAGFFLGYVVFIALESPEFCNKYLRSEPAQDGLVTLPGNFPSVLPSMFEGVFTKTEYIQFISYLLC